MIWMHRLKRVFHVDSGLLLQREKSGVVTAGKPGAGVLDGGLKLSELIAKGWPDEKECADRAPLRGVQHENCDALGISCVRIAGHAFHRGRRSPHAGAGTTRTLALLRGSISILPSALPSISTIHSRRSPLNLQIMSRGVLEIASVTIARR